MLSINPPSYFTRHVYHMAPRFIAYFQVKRFPYSRSNV